MSVRVSVVVPTFRRPELLERCLTALAAQDLPPEDYEVLVADDAVSEDTRRQVEDLSRTSRASVSYVGVRQRHGPAAARNAGWRAARGAVIAFTDDDTIPEPGWLSAGLGVFERDGDLAAATGRVMVPLGPAPTDYERNESGLEEAEFVTANCFVRRSVLAELGGFDERFTSAWREDSDLQFRLLESGAKVIKVPEAVVVHPVRPAAWGISLRQQRKSQFDALLYKKHRELYRRRIRSQPPLDYYGIVAATVAELIATLAGNPLAALLAGVVWLFLTVRFLHRRLRGTSHAPIHVAEMVVTSLAIPFLSIFWRLYGAIKFRVVFF